eukprot:GSChrysophyteH1.ASY1.ANO1.128.1 assembled CDS
MLSHKTGGKNLSGTEVGKDDAEAVPHHMEMPVAEQPPSDLTVVFQNIICGAAAGVLAKSVVAPAERVKMSYQTTKDLFTLSAALNRAKGMVKENGILSLWRGHSTTVLRVAPFAGFSYAFHDYSERKMKANLQVEHLPIRYKFSAGAIGGLCATLLTYPLDVLRVRLALVPQSTWASTIKQGGLFQGLLPTMLGIVPYSGAAWTVKQQLTQHFVASRSDAANAVASLRSHRKKTAPSVGLSLLINAVAGLTGQFVTYPLDVVRRRMQLQIADASGTAPKGMIKTMQELVAVEGLRGLGKGFSLNIIKGPITLSISLTAYDFLMKKPLFC